MSSEPQPPSLWEQGGAGPPVVPPRPMPTTSAMAVVALVFGGLSFITCPIVFAIVALVLAQSASKEIKRSSGMLTGEGLVTAARVLAWVNIGLGVAFVLFVGFFLLFGLILQSMN